VVEGFSGVMRNVVRRNLFKGFELTNEGVMIYHLQYANDTICNRTLKVLLRSFEMTSGPKVNFYKLKVVWWELMCRGSL